MNIISLKEIKDNLNIHHALKYQEEGFRLYSAGKVLVPPVGHINFGENVGDLHIKYGWIEEDSFYVIKIASAFYQNPSKYNLNAIQGMMIAFDAITGKPEFILHDEGYLTNIRTAMAGFISAKYLAPQSIHGIGIVGTGVQAYLQTLLLKELTNCRDIWVWGRAIEKVELYAKRIMSEGFTVHIAKSTEDLCQHCNLIITTTSARAPLIKADAVQPGTHITAVGADSPDKQELDTAIFQRADIVCVDSKSQCIDHGEIQHAIKKGLILEDTLIELGEIIANPQLGRLNEQQITICDLTGVGVQDIQIVKSVLAQMRKQS